MIIEEKNGRSIVSPDQRLLFNLLHGMFTEQHQKGLINYHGLHLVSLETGDPEKGNIYIDNKLVSKRVLRDLIGFKTWKI